ncbi:MAG: ABC transporter permease [Candidatus Freyarchaeota archaeon]|nr:ABC transporter permease [Candidatus Jordarchaeia archaeon]MBS7268793.1 ABC transporter permease [Candidatus Jordarchaeia archaeon]MBS7278223.1 ABC transporter permease [Candidatus Jordarchaeia archaeon]
MILSKGYTEQVRRAFVLAKKDMRIYYFKGPVIIFGVLIPLFLFLAFSIGRNITINSLVSGLLAMTLFFTATAVSPVIIPWETTMRTLERLVSTPIMLSTIILGNIIASFIFAVIISAVPIIVGVVMGATIGNPLILILGIIIAALCFSSLGVLLSTPPSSMPSTIMMLASLLKFPLIFISGIFIPVEQMPGWGQALAIFSPLTYFTDLARHATQGIGYFPIPLDVGVLIAFTAVFLLTAIKLHKRNLSKRL